MCIPEDGLINKFKGKKEVLGLYSTMHANALYKFYNSWWNIGFTCGLNDI